MRTKQLNSGTPMETGSGSRTRPVTEPVRSPSRPPNGSERTSVFMAHGFGQISEGLSRANGRGASDTKMMRRYELDPISGGAGLRVNFVRIAEGG